MISNKEKYDILRQVAKDLGLIQEFISFLKKNQILSPDVAMGFAIPDFKLEQCKRLVTCISDEFKDDKAA